jgi:hypothetical protein
MKGAVQKKKHKHVVLKICVRVSGWMTIARFFFFFCLCAAW